MADKILRRLIDGRNVEDMKYSEAAKLVGDFYLLIMLATFGTRSPKRVEYMVDKALKKVGLEYFC